MAAKEITKALYDCTEAAAAFETGIARVMTIAGRLRKPRWNPRKVPLWSCPPALGWMQTSFQESTYQGNLRQCGHGGCCKRGREATKLAIGGFTDTATAIDILTTAMNAYGLGTDQGYQAFGRAGDDAEPRQDVRG